MSDRTRHRAFALLLVLAACAGLFGGVSVHAAGDPDSPEAKFGFAEGLYLRQFYDLAEKEYRTFAEAYPDHEQAPLAQFRLILCLRKLDRQDDVLEAINRFQARWPQHEWAAKLFLWKGEILFSRKRYDVAAACFRRLESDADTAAREAGLYFLARCQSAMGKNAEALATYGLMAELPFDAEHIYRPYAVFAVAAAAQEAGDFAKARAGYARLTSGEHVPGNVREESGYRLAELAFVGGETDTAIGLYENLLTEFPEGVFAKEARKRRAWAYFLKADFDRTVSLCRDWRQRYGDVFDYEMDYILAAGLAGLGNHTEALAISRALVGNEKVPDDYRRMAEFQEVVCLHALARHDETVTRAEAFAVARPKAAELPTVLYYAGEALFAQEKYEDSAARYRRALDSFVGDWDFHRAAGLRLVECFEKLSRPRDAAAVYRRLATDGNAEGAPGMLLRAGRLERDAKEPEAAIRDFESLLEKFPRAAEETRIAMMNLGELYSEQGDFGRAGTIVAKLLETADPADRGRLLFFQGYLAFRAEDYARAVPLLRESLAGKTPGAASAEARFYLAASLLELEQEDEALETFREVLELPAEERPAIPASLLFRLDDMYYRRNRYDLSETVCRWLMQRNEGAVVYRAGLRLADILLARGEPDPALEALENLQGRLARGELKFGESPAPPKEEILSLLGEIDYVRGEYDRAFSRMEECLAAAELDIGFRTRARYVLAEIMFREDHPKQALPYAVKCFVLADDPRYTPRAMLLAVRIFAALSKPGEAATTWKELRERYPAFAEAHADDPTVLAVGGAGPPEGN